MRAGSRATSAPQWLCLPEVCGRWAVLHVDHIVPVERGLLTGKNLTAGGGPHGGGQAEHGSVHASALRQEPGSNRTRATRRTSSESLVVPYSADSVTQGTFPTLTRRGQRYRATSADPA